MTHTGFTPRLARYLGLLGTVLVLLLVAGPGQGDAAAAAIPPAGIVPRAPQARPIEQEATAITAHSGDHTVAAMRRELLDYVSTAYGLPAAAGTGDLNAVMPLVEAQLAVQELSDAEVVRIHEALPIIHNWPTVQARMAAGLDQPASRPPRGTRTFSPSETAELEQLRAVLDAVFVQQQTWSPLVGSGDPAYLDHIDDARALVQGATTEDLADLRDALSWVPDWQTTLAPDVMGLLEPSGPGLLAQADSPLVDGVAGARPLVTSEQCSDADRSRNVLPLIIAAAAVKGTALIAGYVANFFTKDVKICIGLIVAVVCVDFPNPVFFILKFVELAGNRVVDGLNAAVLVAGVCTSIDHWRLTVDHRDNFLIKAQDILASLITRHNELIQRTETVDFENREAWKLDLQLAIEENLLLPAPAPDGSDENRISLFQLTDTVCFNPDELLPTPVPPLPTPNLITPAADIDPPPDLATLPTPMPPTVLADRREQCGITLVKRIVDEAIQLNKLAGNDVHDADNFFAAANIHFVAGRWKEAYLRYREAYRAAVQPDAEPRTQFGTSMDR